MCTDPLIPVPKLLGQQVMQPKIGWVMNTLSFPVIFFNPSSITLIPSANLENTLFTSPPFSMEMILRWSPSLIQSKNYLSTLWKIPLPSGQY